MSTINYTYNVIVDRFRQFAAGHFQLRRFTHGEISQADLEKEAEWPWLHVKPRAINYAPGTRTFSFEIFISDLPRDKEDKTGYQAESITDCSLIFQDLINEIYLGNMFGSDVVLTRPVNAEPFVEQYTHTLTGVTGTIELNLDYDWSACSIPASWNYNTPTDSPSDGWGALQFIESLDQNGVFVSLLNDVEAPGNSYYYGTNASGVKGWYAIVDNVGLTCETLPDCATIISIVDDIAALESGKVDKVAGKGLSTEDYTTAEKSKLAGIEAGAEVNVNADWNAVSGDAQILNKPTIPSIAGLVPETRTLTINGTTQDLSADRTFNVGTFNLPSLTSGSVLFSNGTTIAQDNANLFWNDTNNRLGIGTATPSAIIHSVGSVTAATAIARGNYLQPTLVASANNDVLVGLDIQPTFTTGAFTGVRNFAIRCLTGDIYTGSFVYAFGLVGNAGVTISSSGTNNVSLATNSTGSEKLRIFGSTGNVTIQNGGTFTDAGYRLDVNGSVRTTGSISAASAIARGTYLNQTLVATANNDVLIGLDIASTFTAGAFTGVAQIGLRVQSGAVQASIFSSVTSLSFTSGSSTQPITFFLNQTGTAIARFFGTTGNLLLQNGGTFTDAGYRLDVNGTARVNVGATNPIIFGRNVTYPTVPSISMNNTLSDTLMAGFFADDLNFYINSPNRIIIRGSGNANNSSFVFSNGAMGQGYGAYGSNPSSVNGIFAAGKIGVGTNAPNASAKMQIDSTTEGFLPPRMTTTQKNAIASPAAGLVVYDTTLGKLCVRTASAWETITSI